MKSKFSVCKLELRALAVCIAVLSIGTYSLSVFAKSEKIKSDYAETLFAKGKLASVELEMPDTTWQNLIQNARRKDYHLCSVIINGERLDSVAIRTKGASSLDDVAGMKSNRFSFTLKLNQYRKGQKYHGLSKLLLNNNVWDATQMKDAIVYDMAHFMGLPAPLTNYAQIMVNGQLHGYYLLVEPVNKDFCRRNYPKTKSNIYKPYYNLAYKGDDLKAYGEIASEAKVGGGEQSLQRIVAAFKSVDSGENIENHVDVESLMKYMALQTMAVNYDCMTGHNTQNFYLQEADGKISLIPWDYNLAWGGYPDDDFGDFGDFGDLGDFGGLGNFDPSQWGGWGGNESFSCAKPGADLGKSTPEEVTQIVNFPINTPFTDKLEKRKFFMNLLNNETYRARYYYYLDLLCRKYVQGGGMNKTIKLIHKEIGKKAGTEENTFYTNQQYHDGVEMLCKMLRRKAQSIMGQMSGTVPSTWNAQKEHPEKLIPSDDINLRLTGGLGY